MGTDRRPFRYKDPKGEHSHEGKFCAGCETFNVLRQVEGFHEELPRADDATIHAVEAAALRGFVMGIELVTRRPIGKERLREIEAEAAGFLA